MEDNFNLHLYSIRMCQDFIISTFIHSGPVADDESYLIRLRTEKKNHFQCLAIENGMLKQFVVDVLYTNLFFAGHVIGFRQNKITIRYQRSHTQDLRL